MSNGDQRGLLAASAGDGASQGGKAIGAGVDVADKAALQGWVTSAAEELGGIDILVPNVSAGGGQMDENGWRMNFEVDLLGTTNGIEAALPFLKASDAGAIVIISSTAAVTTVSNPIVTCSIQGWNIFSSRVSWKRKCRNSSITISMISPVSERSSTISMRIPSGPMHRRKISKKCSMDSLNSAILGPAS